MSNNFDSFNNQKLSAGTSNTQTSSIFVIAEGVSLDATIQKESKLTDTSSRNYTCKLSGDSGKEDLNCVVKLIDPLSENKKQINLQELNSLSATDPKIQDLITASKYFKVTLSTEAYSAITWTGTPQKIEIFSTESTPMKIGSLNPIVGIKNNDVNGKTLYSVGKISKFKNNDTDEGEINNVTIAETETKCLFLTDTTTQVPCKINKFVDNTTGAQTTLKTLSFNGAVKTETNIEKDKYYLFSFEGDSNKKQKSEFTQTADAKVEVTGTITVSDQKKTINKIEVTNLSPAILLGSISSGSLLILSQE